MGACLSVSKLLQYLNDPVSMWGLFFNQNSAAAFHSLITFILRIKASPQDPRNAKLNAAVRLRAPVCVYTGLHRLFLCAAEVLTTQAVLHHQATCVSSRSQHVFATRPSAPRITSCFSRTQSPTGKPLVHNMQELKPLVRRAALDKIVTDNYPLPYHLRQAITDAPHNAAVSFRGAMQLLRDSGLPDAVSDKLTATMNEVIGTWQIDDDKKAYECVLPLRLPAGGRRLVTMLSVCCMSKFLCLAFIA